MNRLCHPEMAKKACNMYPPYFSPFLNSISFWIMIMQSVLSYIFLLSFLGKDILWFLCPFLLSHIVSY